MDADGDGYSTQKGNTKAAEGQLNAFINEVSAQKGKKIPAADADRLIAETQAIIAIIPSWGGGRPCSLKKDSQGPPTIPDTTGTPPPKGE